jgi:hypothetical protein
VIPSEGRNGGRARPGVDPRSFRKRIAAARSPSSSPLALQSANEEEWIPQRRQATERRPAHRARSRRSGTGCEGRGSGYPARDASTAWPPAPFSRLEGVRTAHAPCVDETDASRPRGKPPQAERPRAVAPRPLRGDRSRHPAALAVRRDTEVARVNSPPSPLEAETDRLRAAATVPG